MNTHTQFISDSMSVKNYPIEWSFSVSNNWRGGDWDMFKNTKDSDNNWIDQDNNIIIQSDGKIVNKNLFKGSLKIVQI